MHHARLYAIVDLGYVAEADAGNAATALLQGGADLLQLRAKNHDIATIRRVAETLIPLCRAAGVPFILNDHPALAGELGADGVHIGQDDGSLEDARRAFERGMRNAQCGVEDSGGSASVPHSALHTPRSPLVGRSTHSLEQARAALEEGFDYIGFGPLFPTPTKQGRPGIGLENIRSMEAEVGSQIPAFCIGGIKRENLADVLAAGARRVVIVSDLLTAKDVRAATSEVVDVLHSTR